jgi:hypothetical protein
MPNPSRSSSVDTPSTVGAVGGGVDRSHRLGQPRVANIPSRRRPVAPVVIAEFGHPRNTGRHLHKQTPSRRRPRNVLWGHHIAEQLVRPGDGWPARFPVADAPAGGDQIGLVTAGDSRHLGGCRSSPGDASFRWSDRSGRDLQRFVRSGGQPRRGQGPCGELEWVPAEQESLQGIGTSIVQQPTSTRPSGTSEPPRNPGRFQFSTRPYSAESAGTSSLRPMPVSRRRRAWVIR